MAIRSDSYSSTGEVRAVTRHLLDGAESFNYDTRPTLTDVETFINRASGVLNVAVAKHGLSASSLRANSTAKLLADDWVTAEAARWAELTQRGTGYSDEEGSRTAAFKGLHSRADSFLREFALGLKRLGVTQSVPSSAALAFTGLNAPADRADPGDTSLVQPFATRRQFDDPAISAVEDDD